MSDTSDTTPTPISTNKPEPDDALVAVRNLITCDSYTAFLKALGEVRKQYGDDVRFKPHLDCLAIGSTNLAVSAV